MQPCNARCGESCACMQERGGASRLQARNTTFNSSCDTTLASFKVLKPSFATKRLHSSRKSKIALVSQKNLKKREIRRAPACRFTTPVQSESVGHWVVRAAGKCEMVRDESAAGESNHRWPRADKCIEIQNSSKIASHD